MNELLIRGSNALGIPLSDHQLLQFMEYYAFLLFWNKSVNLTTITGEEEVAQKHFIDSLAYTKAFPLGYLNLKFLDIGSGAGFPGVPLKIAFPYLDISLMEPSFKRTSFLHLLNSKLNLNVRIIEKKAEVWLEEERETFDIMMMRAVGHIDSFVNKILGYLNRNGRMIISSGPRPFDFKNNGQRRIETFSYTLPFTTIQRSLLIIHRD
ncbi:MAG: 16S rRNA (guanine(527)-N(7))-methyltransferase RsmG [Nitrospirae bacterium]|nr:16S rRNA (guanine(527)-N(7))-methyltransferase RsmG [Nitrospirota bacterium]MBI3594279.1 16S rRNA (guanine(527)-N(7))-methyltransferase RsmG [Nitrospirota bacterium]